MHKHFQMSSYISRIFTINKPPEILFGHTMHLNVHIIHVGASIAVEVGFGAWLATSRRGYGRCPQWSVVLVSTSKLIPCHS